MEQQNPNIFLTETFKNFSASDKYKYKIFMSNILRLARETKKYNNENFNFQVKNDIFSYSIKDNKWLINRNEFNPTAINGIINFLGNYSNTDLENLENNYEFESYGI